MAETVNFSEEVTKSLQTLSAFRRQTIEFAQQLDKIDTSKYNILWDEKKNILLNCGTFVEFHGQEIRRANFCRERFCPLCQKRRSLKMYSQILTKINSLELEYSCIHVSLTVPNCQPEDFIYQYQLLMSASSALFRLYRSSWKGIGRFFETTYNTETDTYHPHLHCIVLVKPSYFHSRYYISHAQLVEDWGKLVGVKNVQVHMSARGEDKSLIAEVAKYALKPWSATSTDLEFQRVLECFEKLKGRRLVQFYGVLKGLKDIPEDEVLAVADTEEKNIAPFVWDKNLHRYELLNLKRI